MTAPSDNQDTAEVDKQFLALMEGIRTTLPGVQVLFGFLLAIPFQGAFAALSTHLKQVYYVAFLTAAASSLLLIAPSVHQRVRALRTGVRRRHAAHVTVAVRLAVAGSVAFMVSMAAAVFLVTAVISASNLALVAVAVVMVIGTWSWFYLPLVSFEKRPSQDS